MSAFLIESKLLHKSYGDQRVVNDVSLAIKAGEIVTMIGPNGAGKTTLLRMLLGLESPDGGTITRKSNLEIGYMPQHFNLDPALPLSVHGFLELYHSDLKRIEEVAQMTRITQLLAGRMHRLSGGEWRRVLLARAVLRRPELLILDEPMSGVDVSGQVELYRLIETLAKEHHCGVLMVSHDLHVVMASTHHVICLNHHICCEGKPQQLGDDPAFRDVFGEDMASRLALYMHHHDHDHNLHGDVVKGCDHDH